MCAPPILTAPILATLALGLTACGARSTSYDDGGDPASLPPAPPAAFSATVDRVVDGDTFIARRNGRLLRVRLIGVNAPESVKPDAPVECFGKESSAILATLLPKGSVVEAAYEVGGRRDQYGRQLWDVWLRDGRFLQGVLVTRGAVEARLYRPQREYADLLARLGDQARASRAGLWGRCPQ